MDEHCIPPDAMDVSDSIVDLLPQLRLIGLNLKGNISLSVKVELLAEEHCSLVTNAQAVFIELLCDKCCVYPKTKKKNGTESPAHTFISS